MEANERRVAAMPCYTPRNGLSLAFKARLEGRGGDPSSQGQTNITIGYQQLCVN